ncbi:MAG: Hpt domain-containing protein [Pirellulales bacterium]|nr:Hpt domain-containing protein [Pirellulales bacterium]
MLKKSIGKTDASHAHQRGNDKLFDADAALQRLEGDAELFRMLGKIFQEDSVELFSKLSSGLAAGDLALVERAAHSLKGLAANFEATAATEVAFGIEEAARARQPLGLEPRVKELGVQLERLRQALAQWDAA